MNCIFEFYISEYEKSGRVNDNLNIIKVYDDFTMERNDNINHLQVMRNNIMETFKHMINRMFH